MADKRETIPFNGHKLVYQEQSAIPGALLSRHIQQNFDKLSSNQLSVGISWSVR